MDTPFIVFIGGVGAGLAVATPVGPMAALCMQRTLARGFAAGLATGLGAATVHLTFASLAAAGTSLITQSWLGVNRDALAFASAFLLLWFAVKLLRAAAPKRPAAPNCRSIVICYLSAVGIGVLNPMTLVMFMAISPTLIEGQSHLALQVLGVFVVSVTWWLILSAMVAAIRERITIPGLVVINRVAGLMLASLAGLLLATALGFAAQGEG
jgi:threonine/homoserine/homoserine lactone efflux protein